MIHCFNDKWLRIRINRYIMECKYSSPSPSPPRSRELIDTLWNVNSVNLASLFLKNRINRYIMECKFPVHQMESLCDL